MHYAVNTDPALAEKIKARVTERLTKTHAFVFNEDEKWQLNAVQDAFVMFGPSITTRGSAGRGGGGGSAGFADLTGWSVDATGTPQSFLSTDENFQTVKSLHEKHLIVAVSGDFGGPKALRAIGSYLKERGGSVTAFYVSNVEQYLFQEGKQTAFYENVATLPITDASVFIRPYSMRRYGSGPALCGIAGFLKSAQAGRVRATTTRSRAASKAEGLCAVYWFGSRGSYGSTDDSWLRHRRVCLAHAGQAAPASAQNGALKGKW